MKLYADAAAIGVVGDLFAGVLDQRVAVVVDHLTGGIPAAMVRIAKTGPEAHLVGDGSEGRVIVRLVVARRNEILAPPVVHRNAAVHDAVPPGVIIGLP